MKPNKSEKICCEYIKDGECTLNEREKADCCPKNGLYTKSQVDEMIKECVNKAEVLHDSYREEINELKAKLKKQAKEIKDWLWDNGLTGTMINDFHKKWVGKE